MTLDDAAEYVLTFGRHKGKRLDQVPLSYLDWLRGKDIRSPGLREAIQTYCAASWFERELEEESRDGTSGVRKFVEQDDDE